MPEKEKFADEIVVGEGPTPKNGTRGVYYTVKTDKGLVYNINEEVYTQGGPFRPGDRLRCRGVVLPPKPGYVKGSRWVDEYSLSTTSAPVPPPPHSASAPRTFQATQPAPVQPGAHEGWRMGQALNNAAATMPQCTDFPWGHPEYFNELFYRADQFLKASYEYEKGAGKFNAPIPF